ncbi:Protein of unknown function DUF604 [Dillenia turbinata]|uniref:Uncharacterized protein n=1 Tax=Dillenia turbinata TaxID=194707 RepID=A0AAN8VTH2_9MAGN
MSQIREPNHDPFRFSQQGSLFLWALLKGALIVLVIGSVSLILYSAFSSPYGFYGVPQCDTITISQGTDNQNDRTNITHLVFGIGGSVDTWKQRQHYVELWWKPGVTRGFAWLDKEPTETSATSAPVRVSGSTDSKPSVRIAQIVLESYKLGLRNVRWFVMGDDDTVFFTHNLVSVLARYDHNQMYYIGGGSESVEQDVMHSYDMAYGGGGFAISFGLAKELIKLLEGCLERYYNMYGSDEKISACVSEIGVPVTRESGFHQLDLKGDAYGLLAAHPLAPLVSLHHVDAMSPLFPNQNQSDSLRTLFEPYQLDPSRILQQSFCYDHKVSRSLSISWGYTAQIYPRLVPAKELTIPLRTFSTWRSGSDGPFTFNTRPIESDPCARPMIYFLDRAWQNGNGETVTSYRLHVTEPTNHCGRKGDDPASVQRVKAYASKMDPQTWNKASPLHIN